MSDEFLTLLLATGLGVGGALMLSQKPELPTVWYRIGWPRDLDVDGATGFLRMLSGDRRHHIVVLEAVGSAGSVEYRIGIAHRHAAGLVGALRSFVPGVIAEVIDTSMIPAPRFAWELTITSKNRALRLDAAESIARALTTVLAATSSTETVMLQWVLGPRLAPSRVAPKSPAPTESIRDVARLVRHGTTDLDSEQRRALHNKIGEPGFRTIGRLGIGGMSEAGARAIVSRLLGALRHAESPAVHIGLRRTNPAPIATGGPGKDWPLPLNVSELTGLTGWPLGDGAYPGVHRDRPTPLRPAQPAAKVGKGRMVLMGTYPGAEQPLMLSPTDGLQHLHLIGPTGVGKSTLMLNMIVQDIESGMGTLVVDPKGDLIADVLARIPHKRRGDVVIIDPADEERPVGLNVLRATGRSPELIADQVLAVFHGLYKDNWGPRLQDILHASLLTIAGGPGMTLCSLPVLLSNTTYRRQVIATITDEIALKPFWHWFDSISDGERQQAIAPVMNKLRAFLLRPRMRAVIGQADPRFEIGDIFTSNKIVLVSLAKGLLGPEAASLLGSLVVSQMWQATLGRVAVPHDDRKPVSFYADEFQDFVALETDFSDVLTQARGLGVGMILGHQNLAQLSGPLKAAVLSNARSRVAFQLSHDDARAIAATAPELTDVDLQTLPRFQAYASLVYGGASKPYASGVTSAPPEPTSEPEAIRKLSREKYGRPVAEIEAELALLINGPDPGEQAVGRRRRT